MLGGIWHTCHCYLTSEQNQSASMTTHRFYQLLDFLLGCLVGIHIGGLFHLGQRLRYKFDSFHFREAAQSNGVVREGGRHTLSTREDEVCLAEATQLPAEF